MSFFENLKGAITQKSSNLDKPDFYKADTNAKDQLERLKEFYKTAPSNVKSKVEGDINKLEYGIKGEDNVAFELKNSYLPIIVLHDLHIVFDDLSAEIDYLIITKKFTLVIECKNLTGNIEVNNNGDFIRTTKFNGKYKKEGFYSPITQNTRHLEMIKKIRLSRKLNVVIKKIIEKSFHENYKTVVVLANSKTIINMKYAKKEVKEQIIRSDQLIGHINKLLKESKNEPMTEKQMYEHADLFLSLHTPNTTDYMKKYLREDNEKIPIASNKGSEPQKTVTNTEDSPIFKELKEYRYEISKSEGVKPYFIYNNAQIEDLISTMPKTLDDIKKISGFGDIKCQKYGNAILDIIKKYS
ncbi:MAG: HRDC domain-containing protein [Eubacteriales bacterium]